jgi:hypothetical protein
MPSELFHGENKLIFNEMMRFALFYTNMLSWKDYKIDICCFSAKHAALRRKSKGWLAQNQDNVLDWCDISIHGLLFQ